MTQSWLIVFMMVNLLLYCMLLIVKLKKTAEHCFEKINEKIENLQKAIDNEILALVTDSENKMIKMKHLTVEKYPKMGVH